MTGPISNSNGSRPGRRVDVSIVQAVADRRGIDPSELPPLYEWVDPEALTRLFDPPAHRSAGGYRLVFTYAGHTVTVERNDDLSITVDDATADSSAADDSRDESRSDF